MRKGWRAVDDHDGKFEKGTRTCITASLFSFSTTASSIPVTHGFPPFHTFGFVVPPPFRPSPLSQAAGRHRQNYISGRGGCLSFCWNHREAGPSFRRRASFTSNLFQERPTSAYPTVGLCTGLQPITRGPWNKRFMWRSSSRPWI